MLFAQRYGQSVWVRHLNSCVKGGALLVLLCWHLPAVAQERPQKTLTETDRPAQVAADATAKKDTSSVTVSSTASSITGGKRLSEPPTALRTGSSASLAPTSPSAAERQAPTSAPNEHSRQAVSAPERATPTQHEPTTQRPRRASRVESSRKNNMPTTRTSAPATAPVTVAPKADPSSPPVRDGRRPAPHEFSDVLRTLDADSHKSSGDNLSRDRQETTSSGWLSGLWLVIKLAIVIGLIYLTVFLLKLWMSKRPFALGIAAKGDIKVLETVGLGPNRALHLIGIGEQKLLLASTANAVQLLCEVESSAAPALAAAPPTTDGASPQFAAALRALQEVAGHTEDTAEIAASSHGRDGRALLREKILKLRGSS